MKNALIKSRVLLLVLPVLLFAAPAPAGDSSEAGALELVSVLRDERAFAGAHDIEIRDGLAFVAGKGFTSRAAPGGGKYPYEKGRGGSLAIVDVKNPAAAKVLWAADTPMAFEDAETVLPLGGGRWLVGARDVFLFDVSRPSRAKLIDTIKDRSVVDTINGFAPLGDAVFAAGKAGRIFAVDVSGPDRIRMIGSRETRDRGELGWPHDAAFCGDLLVVVSPEGFGAGGLPGRLAVYRVADSTTLTVLPPERWMLVGKLEHARLAGANRVMARGRRVFVGSSLHSGSGRADDLRNNIAVVDLSDPARPRLRGGIDFPDERGPNGLETAGSVVFAAGGRTVQAIDVTDPDHPRELGRFTSQEAFPAGADDAHDLVHHQGRLFVTAQNSHALVILKLGGKRLLKLLESK